MQKRRLLTENPELFVLALEQVQRGWRKRNRSRAAKRHVKALRREAIKQFKVRTGLSVLPRSVDRAAKSAQTDFIDPASLKIAFLGDESLINSVVDRPRRRLKRLLAHAANMHGDTSIELVSARNANATNSVRVERKRHGAGRKITGVYLEHLHAVIMPALSEEDARRLSDLGAVVLDNETVSVSTPAITTALDFPDPPEFHIQTNLKAAHSAGLFGEDVVIGIADTGIDPDHPEFKGRIDEVMTFSSAGVAMPDEKPRDYGGHGTHVAGICVGERMGIAPKARVKVAAVLTMKGSDGVRGTVAQVLGGYNWLVMQGVTIINCSLALTLDTPAYLKTVLSNVHKSFEVGVLTVAAVGNNPENGPVVCAFPARFSKVLAVGAVDDHDVPAGFSGYGHSIDGDEPMPKPDIVAPGVFVFSSLPGGTYGRYSGTSMAAPQVSGAAALLLGKGGPCHLQNNVERLREQILELTVNSGHYDTVRERVGRGRLDFARIDVASMRRSRSNGADV